MPRQLSIKLIQLRPNPLESSFIVQWYPMVQAVSFNKLLICQDMSLRSETNCPASANVTVDFKKLLLYLQISTLFSREFFTLHEHAQFDDIYRLTTHQSFRPVSIPLASPTALSAQDPNHYRSDIYLGHPLTSVSYLGRTKARYAAAVVTELGSRPDNKRKKLRDGDAKDWRI